MLAPKALFCHTPVRCEEHGPMRTIVVLQILADQVELLMTTREGLRLAAEGWCERAVFSRGTRTSYQVREKHSIHRKHSVNELRHSERGPVVLPCQPATREPRSRAQLFGRMRPDVGNAASLDPSCKTIAIRIPVDAPDSQRSPCDALPNPEISHLLGALVVREIDGGVLAVHQGMPRKVPRLSILQPSWDEHTERGMPACRIP